MTIRELQLEVAELLNGVEALVQGGCKAFAEDTHTVYNESEPWVSAGKVAVVVVTPDMQRSGDSAAGIPADMQFLVQCSEKPALVSRQPNVIRALDAAEIAMHALDGRRFCWLSTRQTIDRQTGVLTATATFATTITL